MHPYIYSIPGIHPNWVEQEFVESLYAACSSAHIDVDNSNNNDESADATPYTTLSHELLSLAHIDIVKEIAYIEDRVLQKIDTVLEELHQIATDQSVVGIGECGIDIYKLHPVLIPFADRILALQEKLFVGQINVALSINKPVMIHARESYAEILSILDKRFISKGIALRGNVHFFAGTSEEARAFLERGITVSFTGVITFAKVYEQTVRDIDLDCMMSETDCPFVSPVPYRGRRNEPTYVIEVVRKIAQIKGLEESFVREQLLLTAENRFGLNLRG
jgi:TatD DNase family protein